MRIVSEILLALLLVLELMNQGACAPDGEEGASMLEPLAVSLPSSVGSGTLELNLAGTPAKPVPTGTIAGRVTVKATGAGLSGVALFAETVESGRPSIVRTAVSSADGSYTLNMLALSQTYYIVTRPYVNGTIYGAQSSGAMPLTSTLTSASWNAALSACASPGGVGGAVLPAAAANQSDQVALLQKFPVSGQPWLVIDTTLGQISASAGERYAFPSVPDGVYTVQATRSEVRPDGTTSPVAVTTSAPFTVAAAATTAMNISFP